jgi:hypothetical protein
MTASTAMGAADDMKRAAAAAWWLGGLRAVIFSLWFVKFAGVSLSALASLPADLEPPLLLQAVPPWAWERLLRPPVLGPLQASICVLCVLAALGLRPYCPIAVAVASFVTFEQGLVRSYGYLNHPEIFLLLATWILAFSPAADGFSWQPSRSDLRPAPVYGAVIAFVALVGCWTYAAAGAYRIAHHGLEMFTSASMKHAVVLNSFAHGSGAVGAFLLEHPTVARWIQLALPAATVLEVASPLALRDHRFRRLWLGFLVTFQLLTALSMTIFFWESMLSLGAALIAFDRVTRRTA